MNPTADDVAIAIVAACRETGGDPIAVATAGLGVGDAGTRMARHYALHALVHIFPNAAPMRLCKLVGCPGSVKSFWSNSYYQVVKGKGSGWWKTAIYDRVIRAIEGDRTRRAVAPKVQVEATKPPVEPEKVQVAQQPPPYRPPPLPTSAKTFGQGSGRLEPNGHRPPSGTIAKAIVDELDDDRPVFDRGGQFAERRPYEKPVMSKRDIQEELRRAVANTKPRADE